MTRHRQRYVPLALLLSVALIAGACGGDDSSSDTTSDPSALTGVTWVLDETSIDGLVDEPPAAVRLDISFEDGRASGTSGCNTYGGSYDAGDDGSLTFGALAATQMACEEPVMALEFAYLDVLGEVETFEMTDGGLTLIGGAVSLTYTEEAPMEPLPLEGTAWMLDTIATGTDAVSSVIAGTEVTLTLADGAASGSGGCNTFNGGYTVDGASISIGPLASTMKACEEDVMNQETAVFTGLESAASWSIEGDRLSLLDADGAMLLGYTGEAA